jgi:hypothetical protein
MAKRILKGVVVFFAIYAFVFVPLGKKTAFEHVRAIVGTPAAHEAASEVKGGVTRLVRRLQSEARQSTEDTDRMLDEDTTLEEALPAQPVPKQKLRALSIERPAPGE